MALFSRVDAINAAVQEWAARMQSYGYLRDLELYRSCENRTLRLVVKREDRRGISWDITDEELRDDGVDAVRRVFVSLERELRRAGPDAERFVQRFAPQLSIDDRPWVDSCWSENVVVERKAEDLFKLVAGQAAFDALMGGDHGDFGRKSAGLAIRGSLGTAYHLHRRRTFSVTRDSDGAEFCAVVQGVPLWDHLLGLKLLIEHDEPAFLRTANKSAPVPMFGFDAPILRQARQVFALDTTA